MLDQHEYDGVLMDCQMPEMDGYTASRKIRDQQRFKELPVIAMTAHALKGDRQKVLAAGMNDHIAKPINVNKMFSVMAKWITPASQVENREYEPPSLTQDDSTEIPSILPGVDTRAGLDTTQNNKKLYHRLLLKFRDAQQEIAESYLFDHGHGHWPGCCCDRCA